MFDLAARHGELGLQLEVGIRMIDLFLRHVLLLMIGGVLLHRALVLDLMGYRAEVRHAHSLRGHLVASIAKLRMLAAAPRITELVRMTTWPERVLLRQLPQVLHVIIDLAGYALVLMVVVVGQVEAIDLASRLIWLPPAELVCVLLRERVRVLLGLAQREQSVRSAGNSELLRVVLVRNHDGFRLLFTLLLECSNVLFIFELPRRARLEHLPGLTLPVILFQRCSVAVNSSDVIV